MTHLTREELAAWYRSGDATDRRRIVDHLAVCDDCGRLYGEVIDAQAAPLTSQHADLASAVTERGHRAYGTTNRFPLRWIAAAAAAVVIGAVILPTVTRETQPNGDSDIAVRGNTLQLLSPIGTVTPPVLFTWASPFAAPRYRLEIFDAGGRLLVTFDTRHEQAALADIAQSPLVEGVAYEWQVTAIDDSNSAIATSRRSTFTLTR